MVYLKENQYFVILMIVFLLILSTPYLLGLYKGFKYKRMMIRSGIKDIDKLSGYEFEEYLKVLFKKIGYKPQVTKKSGDFGADLVLKGKNKIVVQAKRYGYKNNVSLDAVREAYSAKAFYQADEAWVITNSFFTKQAIQLAKACNVKLLNRYDLQEFINKVNPEQTVNEVVKNINPTNHEKKCPNCGSVMVVRESDAYKTRFFGCSNYPKCSHTEKIY